MRLLYIVHPAAFCDFLFLQIALYKKLFLTNMPTHHNNIHQNNLTHPTQHKNNQTNTIINTAKTHTLPFNSQARPQKNYT